MQNVKRQKTPLHDVIQKTIYHMEKEEVKKATRGTVIGEVAEKNVSSMRQVSMARDRRTNNPSAFTFMHTKNRSVILLVNLRS